MLFRVLATTGMRLSEAFQIDGEKTEHSAMSLSAIKLTNPSAAFHCQRTCFRTCRKQSGVSSLLVGRTKHQKT